MDNPTPSTYGKEIFEFITWMKNPDKEARPTAREVHERLLVIKKEWEATRHLPFLPNVENIFVGDLTPQHAKLGEFRRKFPAFFAEEITE